MSNRADKCGSTVSVNYIRKMMINKESVWRVAILTSTESNIDIARQSAWPTK